jgi:PKHD-type hydroxylase
MTAEPTPDADHAMPTPSPRHVLYRLWNGVLPDPVCQAVIDTFVADEFYDATIQTSDGSERIDGRTRRAANMFIEPAHWTGALASHFASQGNLVWGLELAGLGTLSILRYEESGHFQWHIDTLAHDQADYPGLGLGLERKLSVTVNLSDPADYDGGDLEFLNGLGQLITQPELRQRGSVIVFPSTVGHRITAITRGVRYALVGWMVGPPLR